ncbi:MAG: hypothetical protein LAO55_06200 [Acidobacteriia bacterium]|nr:hypothetical protein [Terriglobia bacterium]
MKCAVLLLLAAPWVWAANEAADRAAIDKLIASLNDPKARPDAGEVWTEMSHPILVTRSVQFLSPKVARVDAARVQYGSVMTHSVPVVILLEKRRGGWRIVSLREGAEPLPTIQPVRFLPQ